MDAHKRWMALTLGLTAAMEAASCVAHFGFGLHGRDFVNLTGGVRIHHGYVGAALLLALFALPPRARPAAAALGVALVASDVIHHFVVLKLVTGSFD